MYIEAYSWTPCYHGSRQPLCSHWDLLLQRSRTKKTPRMDSQASQSHAMNILPPVKLSRKPLTIRHSASKSFASSSIHHTHFPELVDALWIFQQSSTVFRGLGETFRWSFPIPRNNCPPARTSPAKTSKELPFPIVRNGKNLEMEKICSGRNFHLPPPRRLHLFFSKKQQQKQHDETFEDSTNRRNWWFWWIKNGLRLDLDPRRWRHCTGSFSMP